MAGGFENEVVCLRGKGNLRGKRQDPWRRANDRDQRSDADLAELAWMHSFLRIIQPGLGGPRWQVREFRAEKSHPKAPGGNTGAGSAAGSKRLAIVHADRRSVGKLTACGTRRVRRGAKCQCSGKESVASSQPPSFSQDRKVRRRTIIDHVFSSKRPAGSFLSAGLFVYP